MSAQRRRSPHRWRAPVVRPDQPGRERCPECGCGVVGDQLAAHVERAHGWRLASAFETCQWNPGEVER